MDEKEKKATPFSDLLKLLRENKDKIFVYPPRRRQLVYFEIHAPSPHIIEQLEQFKTLCKTLGTPAVLCGLRCVLHTLNLRDPGHCLPRGDGRRKARNRGRLFGLKGSD